MCQGRECDGTVKLVWKHAAGICGCVMMAYVRMCAMHLVYGWRVCGRVVACVCVWWYVCVLLHCFLSKMVVAAYMHESYLPFDYMGSAALPWLFFLHGYL